MVSLELKCMRDSWGDCYHPYHRDQLSRVQLAQASLSTSSVDLLKQPPGEPLPSSPPTMPVLGDDTKEKAKTNLAQEDATRHTAYQKNPQAFEPKPYETPPDYKAPTMAEQWRYVRFLCCALYALARRVSPISLSQARSIV